MDNAFGSLLRTWRDRRHMSQLDLGLTANVSARHISFLETGRAKPSQPMVMMLGGRSGRSALIQKCDVERGGFCSGLSEQELER